MTIEKPRQLPVRFSSSLATVLTMAGATIGIGNFWRFPYMMGQYGGSAFLLLFMLFMVVFAIPALIAEMTIARKMRASTITIFESSFGRAGRYAGYVTLASMLVLLSMYTLVVGQSLFSAYFAFAIGFRVETFGVWDAEFNNMKIQYIVAVASFWAALLVISFGLRKGIEALSKIIVSVFFLTVSYTIYVAFKQPGVPEQFLTFLMPDFSRIGFKEVFAAMGQCFFSVGLGAIVIIGYAKFLRAEENITSISAFTAFNDSAASVLASLFIIPTALAFGMGLHSGPDLYFNTLPRIFSIMENGRIIGGFLLLAFALMSLMSIVAGLQFVLTTVDERPVARKISRKKLLLIAGLVETLLITLPAFYPGALETIDWVCGSGVIIAGSFLMIVALTWFVDPRGVLSRPFQGDNRSVLNRVFFLWLKWVVPSFLIVILAGTLYEALIN